MIRGNDLAPSAFYFLVSPRRAILIFDQDEIHGRRLLAKKKMPTTTPTVNEVDGLLLESAGSLREGAIAASRAPKPSGRGLDKVLVTTDTLRALREEFD